MTRRDTIIVTALVNAGLLVILFVSALRRDEGKEEIAFRTEAPKISASEVVIRSDARKVMGDEVDLVLKQYTEPNPIQQQASSREFSAQPQAPVSFVEDLKSVTEAVQTEVPAFLTAPTPPASNKNMEIPAEKMFSEVVVKKGDVLEKIARHNHTTVAEIMKLNHLSSTQLKIGQVLKIPSSDIKVAVESKTVEKKALDPTSAKYYMVKSGDNLWTIAVKNHIKVEDLLKLNSLNEEKARKLKPGDRIRIQ